MVHKVFMRISFGKSIIRIRIRIKKKTYQVVHHSGNVDVWIFEKCWRADSERLLSDSRSPVSAALVRLGQDGLVDEGEIVRQRDVRAEPVEFIFVEFFLLLHIS